MLGGNVKDLAFSKPNMNESSFVYHQLRPDKKIISRAQFNPYASEFFEEIINYSIYSKSI